MKYLIYIFIFSFFYKLFNNLYDLHRMTLLENHFKDWLKNPKNTKIFAEQQEVLNLLKKAKVKDKKVPISQHTGYNKFVVINASIQTNFLNRSDIFTVEITIMFWEAIGVFRNEIKNCINPLYWLNIILFAPKHLLIYLGGNPENHIFRILNIFLTIIFWTISFIFSIFQEEIKTFILSYFP